VVAPTAVVHAGQNGVEAAGGASVVAVGPTGVALLNAAYPVVACGYRVLSPTYMGTCAATCRVGENVCCASACKSSITVGSARWAVR